MRLALLTALVLAAGCVAEAPTPEPADAAPDDLAQEPATAAPLPLPVPTDASNDLSALLEFHWHLPQAASLLAIEATWDFGQANECTFSEATRNGPGYGISALSLDESEQGVSWSYGSGGDLVSAHAGPVDSREASDGGGGTGSSGSGPVDGVVRQTFLYASVEPGELTFITDGSAAAFSIDCEKPFSLLSARQGTVGFLVDPDSLSGGAGAQVFVAGGAGVADSATATLDCAECRIAVGSFGDQAGVVSVTTPTESDDWVFEPTGVAGEPSFVAMEGGPGAYGITVERGGAVLEAFWGASWGWDGPLDLGAGRLDDSAIDFGF